MPLLEGICHAGFPPQTAKRWPGFRHKSRKPVDVIQRRRLPSFESLGVRIGMDVMLSDYRHWLEYDPVALAVLLVGVGFVELIVLII